MSVNVFFYVSLESVSHFLVMEVVKNFFLCQRMSFRSILLVVLFAYCGLHI